MGKKGSKRKTRWRTLSIGAPPGEEDEEDGLRNGYVKNREAENGSVHSYDRNDQSSGGYKPRRSGLVGNSTVGSTVVGDSGGGSRSRRDETPGSPSQPKIIFNEDEYTRITTPRQDVLFKKSYLSRKKPWASNASTSATPSTTESQSASHSTADGSETTEDQQLLDRDCGAGEYTAPVMEPGAQISYGTFYDHGSGYYYEYPVMLVGPAPIPAPVGPSVLAAVPCGPVPLRPIEWINPAFVPKLAGQSYCLMDYQTGQSTEGATLDEISDFPQPPMDISNGTCNESGTGSASCSGSVAGEMGEEQQQVEEAAAKNAPQDEKLNREQNVEQDQQPTEEQGMEENGMNGGGAYLEPVLVQQPVHMSHVSHVPHVSHVVPAVPQPYMYPGHYMFGPPLVNVNGVTIQGGPMIRTTDVAAMAAAYAKRRKKKKRRKQRRPALGNTEGDEEEEYSSEYDNGVLSSRLSWSACATSTPDVADVVAGSGTRAQNHPLNPECQEFQLRSAGDGRAESGEKCVSPSLLTTSDETPNSDGTFTTSNPIDTLSSTIPDSVVQAAQSESSSSLSSNCGLKDMQNESNGSLSANSDQISETTPKDGHSPTKTERRRRRRNVNVETSQMNGTNNSASATEDAKSEVVVSNVDATDVKGDVDDKSAVLTNGESGLFGVSKDGNKEGDVPSETNQRHESLVSVVDSEKVVESKKASESRRKSEQRQNPEAKQNSENSVSKSRRKYSSKGSKFVREATPGPDLSNERKEVTEHGREKVIDGELENDSVRKEREAREPTPVGKVEKVASKNKRKNINCEGSKDVSSTGTITVVKDTTKPITILDETVTKSAQRAGIDSISSETTNEIEMKAVSDGIAECSTEDSGFESQTRTSDYPITEAVTEWLRRANSPEMFVTSAVNSASDSEDGADRVDGDVEMEDTDKRPSKNLQGNPMPALSANGEIHSSWASYGEFARANSNDVNGEKKSAVDQEVESREREKNERNRANGTARKLRRDATCSTRRRSDDTKTELLHDPSLPFDNAPANVMLIDNAGESASRIDVVGNTCEFTEMDSAAGMRVASSSRMGLTKVESSRKRGRRSGKYKRDLAEVVDVKVRRSVESENGNEVDVVEDTISVRTFEKGEIVVSMEGKFLPITSYQPFLRTNDDQLTPLSEVLQRNEGDETDNVTTNVFAGSLHIEEPDVLECWEAETIEPVITSKRMLQNRGVSYDGEAAEEDTFQPEAENVERVQRYYRLAEETDLNDHSVSSCTSNPYGRISRLSATVPNSPNQVAVESALCFEEIPTSSERQSESVGEDSTIPVDEAFEAYESCYNGKPSLFALDSNLFKPRTLRQQDGEGPIPCRAACCNIQ